MSSTSYSLDATARVAVVDARSMGAGMADDLEGAVRCSQMSAAERNQMMAGLMPVRRLEDHEGEAIVEKLEPKRYRRLPLLTRVQFPERTFHD